jgi:hypothetical protein
MLDWVTTPLLHEEVSAMLDLTTTIIHHDLFRVLPCCLCGAEWEERWVGVALVARGRALGDLCPRCLGFTPKTAIKRLRDFGERLKTLGGQMQECLMLPLPQVPPLGSVDAIQAETARVKERTVQMREIGQQLRDANAQCWALTRQSLAQLAKLQQELQRCFELKGETEGLALLEDGLSRLETWPTRLAEPIRIERACFAQLNDTMSDLEVRRSVDDRYYKFLYQAA